MCFKEIAYIKIETKVLVCWLNAFHPDWNKYDISRWYFHIINKYKNTLKYL